LTAFPDLLFIPLMPTEPLPSFALASVATAARIEAAFLVLLGSSCGCLADASEKGNLTKSDTYKYAVLRHSCRGITALKGGSMLAYTH
jgi:hypothetical protein